MEKNKSVGQANPRGHSSGGLVSDNEPSGSWEAVVEDICYGADVGVDIGGDNLGWVDVCNP